MFTRYIAKQLISPHGFIGKYCVGRIWNRRNAALNDKTLQHLHLQPSDRVLDVGFGGGYLLSAMQGIVTDGLVAGIDASPLMVANAKRAMPNGPDLHLGTVEALPFADVYFSKICSVNSIFYWPDRQKGIQEIHRVLYNDGLFVLCFTGQQDLDKRGFKQYGVRSCDEAEINSILRSCGFTPIERRQYQDDYRVFFVITAKKRVGL
jgi:arsenite methyltransferase